MPDWRNSGTPGSRAIIIGAALSALWLVMLSVFWLSSGEGGGPGWWVSAVAALTPLGLIWLAVGLAQAIDTLKSEAEALRALLERNALRDEPPRPSADAAPARAAAGPSVLSAPSPRPARSHAAAAAPAARSTEAGAAAKDPRQTSLGLDGPEPVEIPSQTVIRALNFPDGPDDQDAVAALREALRDPDQARLIRSAQDVITLLADRGIYTEDLEPEFVDPAAWRRFGDGQRGQAVSSVGAVRNPELLEAATLAMRGDDVFRDAVHHFLRLFDRGVTAMMPRLTDDEIVWLSETRSARIFMLLARAAGLFGQEEA